MKIATLLFTYNRSWHTEQVLFALKKNSEKPQILYIFQDGVKTGDENIEWRRVNRLINSVDWCNKEIIVSDCNRGLSASILAGINYVMKNYDAIIVLEDDCVPANNFLSYMRQCLEKYKDYENVYSISGYNSAVEMPEDIYDVYGCGRISSWGWGTWKDKWQIYKKDYEIISRIRADKDLSRHLAVWGSDLEKTLLGNIRGTTNSWAVFWALSVIERKGICIYPYHSLIKNIGMDGTGVHCGTTSAFDVELDMRTGLMKLPDNICLSDAAECAYIGSYGSPTAHNVNKEKKEKVWVYGLSDFFVRKENAVNTDYYIEGFIDRRKTGYYAGKNIIKPDRVSTLDCPKILIMIENLRTCIDIVQFLRQQGIDYRKIIIGAKRYEEKEVKPDDIEILSDGTLL